MRPSDGRRGITLAALVALASAACTPLDNALASVPIFAFLRTAPSFDPYEAPRPAPAGAIPFASPAGGFEPAVQPVEASLRAFAASPYGQNPLAPGAEVELGAAMYERYCMVCHAPQGQGNGPVVGPGKVPIGPALATGNAVTQPDGYIYAIIKAGRTLMPAYGSRTTQHERWAIVNYVRQLQGGGAGPAAAPPAAADTTGAAAGDTAR